MKSYFSHDSNARSDEKIVALRIKYGWSGYGLYWALIEKLRDDPSYKLKADYDILSYDLRTEPEIIKGIINDFDLFVIEDDLFYSESLLTRMRAYDEKSEKARQSANYRWNKERLQCETNANAMRTHSDRNANKIILDKNNKKESTNVDKKKNLIAAKAATLSRKDEFYKSLIPYVDKYPKDMIRAFFDYWSEMNKSETKMRFEKEPTWEVGKRLSTWANRETFNGKTNRAKTNSDSTDRKQSVRNLTDLSEAILQGAVAQKP